MTKAAEGSHNQTFDKVRKTPAFRCGTRAEMEQQLRFVSHPETKPQTEVLPSDVRKVIVGEEEQQEWSSRVEQEQPEPPHIKEEQEELWTSQEGEQLQGLEEADISKLPFPPVPVKSEDDEEKPQSSQLHQSPAEESREVEPLSSSSTHHLKTEADGDHCGGPEPASNLDPDTLLHPDTEGEMSDSPETENDEQNCIKLTKTNSSLNSVKNRKGAEIDQRYNSGEKSTTCSECGKIFNSKSSLNRHRKIHTGEKPFSCSLCCKKFRQNSDLVTHFRIHTAEKPFSCSVCNTSFTRRLTLVRHMRTHTGEKPFSCSVCQTRFIRHLTLVRHMRTHTGEKPFVCSICGKRFSEKGDMTKHMRTHTGEKPFVCSICGKRFSEKGDLTKHIRIHVGEKPFICLVCGKRCSEKGDMTKHMRTHTGEKPYICSFCGKNFAVKGNMMTHVRRHTGEKPFSCSVCDRSFTWKYQFKSHSCEKSSSK